LEQGRAQCTNNKENDGTSYTTTTTTTAVGGNIVLPLPTIENKWQNFYAVCFRSRLPDQNII